jgi:hypothetical protein
MNLSMNYEHANGCYLRCKRGDWGNERKANEEATRVAANDKYIHK